MINNLIKLIYILFLGINRVRPYYYQIFIDLFEPHYDKFYEIVYSDKSDKKTIKEEYKLLLENFKFRDFAIKMNKVFIVRATDIFKYYAIHDSEEKYFEAVAGFRTNKNRIEKMVYDIQFFENKYLDYQKELYEYLNKHIPTKLTDMNVIQPANYIYSRKIDEKDIDEYNDRVSMYKEKIKKYRELQDGFLQIIKQNKSELEKTKDNQENINDQHNFRENESDEAHIKIIKEHQDMLNMWSNSLDAYEKQIEEFKIAKHDYLNVYELIKQKTNDLINHLLKTLKDGIIQTGLKHHKGCDAYNDKYADIKGKLFLTLSYYFNFGGLNEDLSFSKPNPYYNKLQEQANDEEIYKKMSEVIHFKNLLERIQEDQQIIKKMLNIEGSSQLQLIDIDMNNGDYHTQGGGVSILSFKKNDGQAKLI